jgi:sulfur carrier protein ThiS
MRITVKTAGLLGKYLPPGSAPNLAELEVKQGASPLDVIRQLGMPPEDSYLVSVNGAIVPPSKREAWSLCDNDKLSIMPPLRAG